MKRFTKAMVAVIADGMKIAGQHYGREAKAARDQGMTEIATACQSKVTQYQMLESLFRGGKRNRGTATTARRSTKKR